MTSGRTVWQAQDAGWWRRERVALLGEQFGSEGPAIANWLECEAKAQNSGGRVKAGYATAARGAFVQGGADRAREIVTFAVEIGFLDEFEVGERTFKARVAAYVADQATGRARIRKHSVYRPYIPRRVRLAVVVRDDFTCRSCGATAQADDFDGTAMPPGFELDHVHAFSRGGTGAAENLQLLCKPCNRQKGARP